MHVNGKAEGTEIEFLADTYAPQSELYSPEGRLFVHPAAAGLRPDRLDAVVDERALHPRDHHLLRNLPEERHGWLDKIYPL